MRQIWILPAENMKMNRKTREIYTAVVRLKISLLALVLGSLGIASLVMLTPQAGAQNSQKLATGEAKSTSAAVRSASDPKIVYPESKKVEHFDTYFGTKVPDPYRWLEDENAPETAAWVEAQNRVTFAYLEKIPFRQQVKQRLEKLYNYPRFGSPFRVGEYFFYAKNDGLQNQSVWYIQKGLDGAPEVLIDPNKLSSDGTAVLNAFSPSKDGKYLAYGVSQGGSDWIEVYVIDVASRKGVSDDLKWMKVSGVSWAG